MTSVVDPVRQRVVEALARRTEALDGLAREHLLRRVAQLRGELQGELRSEVRNEVQAGRHAVHAAPPASAPSGAGLSALSALIDRLGRTHAGPAGPAGASVPGAARRVNAPPPRPLKAVSAFKGTWSRLRAEQRLRQALAQVPAKAGPLHSSQVVHRALQALHGLSPAYLDAFMSHVDTLLWLEQASGGTLPRARRAPSGNTRAAAGPGSG